MSHCSYRPTNTSYVCGLCEWVRPGSCDGDNLTRLSSSLTSSSSSSASAAAAASVRCVSGRCILLIILRRLHITSHDVTWRDMTWHDMTWHHITSVTHRHSTHWSTINHGDRSFSIQPPHWYNSLMAKKMGRVINMVMIMVNVNVMVKEFWKSVFGGIFLRLNFREEYLGGICGWTASVQ